MFFYIDPGTGSMLFTILIGLFGTLIYSIKIFKVKIKTLFGGKKAELENRKIPFVIYSDDKRYWSIFEPICEKLDTLDKEVLYLTASEDDPVFKKEYKNIKAECIGKDNSSFFRLNYLNANIVLSTTPSLGVFQWKRSKKVDYYVHVLHAAGDVTMYRMFGIDYYDAVLLSGDYQENDIRALEKLRNLPNKELVKIGIPYMDEMAKRLEKAGEVAPHPRTVLLAPTWGSSGLFGRYGDRIIEELVKTGYHVIIRPHPQSFSSETEMIEGLMAKYPESENLEWNRDTDNFEVLRRSDVMVSDFSGVIMDFALIYGKPVIYTDPNFDLGPYDAWWLDQPIWTVTALERMGYKLTEDNLSNVKELIDDCLDNPSVKEKIKEIKAETWAFEGEGAERAFVYLKDKHEQILAEQEEKKEQERLEKEKKQANKWWKRKKKTEPEVEPDKHEALIEELKKDGYEIEHPDERAEEEVAISQTQEQAQENSTNQE